MKVSLTTLFILSTLLVGRWYSGGKSFSHFMVLGEQFVNPADLPFSMSTVPDSGYDGQFFARTALKPWTNKKTELGIEFDRPAYRHSRIFYPLLAHLLSFGQLRLVPFTLVLVNLLSLVGLTYLVSQLAVRYHLPPSIGFFPAAFGGLVLGFGRDLAEPLAGFLVVASITALLNRNTGLYLALIILAILTREVALLTAAGIGLALFFNDLFLEKNGSKRWLLYTIPLWVFLIWQYFMYLNWGLVPILNSPANLGPPFVGFFQQLFANPYLERPAEMIVQMLYLLWNICLGIEVSRSLWLSRMDLIKKDKFPQLAIACAWIMWLLFSTSISKLVWIDDWSFSRVLSEWALLGLLLMVSLGRRFSIGLTSLTLLVFLGSFARLILRP